MSTNANVGEKKKIGEGITENAFDWNTIVVLTRRYFNNDWKKIVEKLKEQLDLPISYKPFHANKALILFEDKEKANLICKNKGWTTVGRFYVKFEEWNQKAHAAESSAKLWWMDKSLWNSIAHLELRKLHSN